MERFSDRSGTGEWEGGYLLNLSYVNGDVGSSKDQALNHFVGGRGVVEAAWCRCAEVDDNDTLFMASGPLLIISNT